MMMMMMIMWCVCVCVCALNSFLLLTHMSDVPIAMTEVHLINSKNVKR